MSGPIEHQKLTEFIRRRGGAITPREITQSYWPLKNQREKVEAMLSELVASGRGRWDDVKTTAQGGRPTRRFRLLPREIPVIHPPDERPQPYLLWTRGDKRLYGMGNSRTQWELAKRIGAGMSVPQAADDIGLPLADVQRFIARNPRFKKFVQSVRERTCA
jgi:hypothetical protein